MRGFQAYSNVYFGLDFNVKERLRNNYGLDITTYESKEFTFSTGNSALSP